MAIIVKMANFSSALNPDSALLPEVTATRLKNAFSEVFDLLKSNGAVAVTRHEKPQAILISVERYESLLRAQRRPLEELGAEFDELLRSMQTAKSRRGMDVAFNADSASVGRAAVAARK